MPEQQPEQLLELQVETALHLPKKQPCPVGHAPHVWPLMPQTCADCIEVARQTPARQQPLGQVNELQPVVVTQLPREHTLFAGQFEQFDPSMPQRSGAVPG